MYAAGSQTSSTASYAGTTNKVSLGKWKTTFARQAVTWPAHLPPETSAHPPPETDSKQGLVAACLESHCLSYFRGKHLEELNIVALLQVQPFKPNHLSVSECHLKPKKTTSWTPRVAAHVFLRVYHFLGPPSSQ